MLVAGVLHAAGSERQEAVLPREGEDRPQALGVRIPGPQEGFGTGEIRQEGPQGGGVVVADPVGALAFDQGQGAVGDGKPEERKKDMKPEMNGDER